MQNAFDFGLISSLAFRGVELVEGELRRHTNAACALKEVDLEKEARIRRPLHDVAHMVHVPNVCLAELG